MNYLFDDTDCKYFIIVVEIQNYTNEQLAYIAVSLKQFNDINEIFVNFEKAGARIIPKLKVALIPIDEKEIRPDKIDDW